MLSEKMLAGLNDQINMEMQAYYTYLSMSAYFEDKALKGFASWMSNHSQEEMTHAMKIYDFINSRRGRVKLGALTAPPQDWDTPLEAIESAMEHEQKAVVDELIQKLKLIGDFSPGLYLLDRELTDGSGAEAEA